MLKGILIVSISFCGLLLGGTIFLWPLHVIKFQQKFYEKINWKIEPISLSKEIRNTKVMGLCLLIFIVVTFVYLDARF